MKAFVGASLVLQLWSLVQLCCVQRNSTQLKCSGSGSGCPPGSAQETRQFSRDVWESDDLQGDENALIARGDENQYSLRIFPCWITSLITAVIFIHSDSDSASTTEVNRINEYYIFHLLFTDLVLCFIRIYITKLFTQEDTTFHLQFLLFLLQTFQYVHV